MAASHHRCNPWPGQAVFQALILVKCYAEGGKLRIQHIPAAEYFHHIKAKAGFEDQLSRIGTDYIDVGMIHYVDSESDFDEVFNGAIMEYCKELKADGKILSIGLSSHNPAVARKAVSFL